MGLKENINQLHSELSQKYEVSIEEGSNRQFGNFVKLSINEGQKNLVAFITKSNLEMDNFNWAYKSNPINESSDLIERVSSVSNFTNHIEDIFNKNRFDSEYLKNLD